MTLRPAFAAVVTVAFAFGMVAACGSDDGTTGTTSTTAGAAEAPTTTTAVPETTLPTTEAPPTTAAPATTTTTTTAAAVPMVFDFTSEAGTDGWRVVNDTVMGGVSIGELEWSDGALTFTGQLSLENNGGFASIRSPEIDPGTADAWATRPGVRVEVDGDGRTWTVEVRTDGESGGWISTVATSRDGATALEIPWAAFEPVTRFLDPRATSEPLDPARITTIAFYLVDGIEGPFRLGLRSIG